MTIKILHHSDTDGYGAAFAAWEVFKDTATYIPVNYGQPEPEIKEGDEVYILDFSYPEETLKKWHTLTGRKVKLIDHHKTSLSLTHLDYCLVDISKAGCVLAWEYFFPKVSVPQILLHIQDWDLWKFELPKTKEVHAVAEINKANMSWYLAANSNLPEIIKLGEVLENYKGSLIASLCKNAFPLSFLGYKAICISGAYPLISDTGEYLLSNFPDVDLAIIYTFLKDKAIFSFRSRTLDVSEIAKCLGGGGHKSAAGANVSPETALEILREQFHLKNKITIIQDDPQIGVKVGEIYSITTYWLDPDKITLWRDGNAVGNQYKCDENRIFKYL